MTTHKKLDRENPKFNRLYNDAGQIRNTHLEGKVKVGTIIKSTKAHYTTKVGSNFALDTTIKPGVTFCVIGVAEWVDQDYYVSVSKSSKSATVLKLRLICLEDCCTYEKSFVGDNDWDVAISLLHVYNVIEI